MSKSPEPTSVFSRIRRDRLESPRHRDSEREAVFTRLERKEKAYSIGWEVKEEVCLHARVTPNHNDTGTPKGKQRAVTKAPVQEKQNPFPESVTIKERLHREWKRSQKVKIAEEDTGSQDRKNKSQALKKTTYPNHGEDPKDRLKIFHAAFNFKLTGSARVWFDDLPPESVDSYDDLKKRFKSENRHVKEASECMRISGFIHGITNPELIKRLHNNIPKSMDKMMRATTTFLRGRKRVTQSFSTDLEISFPPLRDEDGTEGPMIIEAEIGAPSGGMILSKITRKPLKTGKHGHEERKSSKEAKNSKPKAGKVKKVKAVVNSWSILTEKAQGVSIKDCHAGNPCELPSDLTANNDLPIIEELYGQDQKECGKQVRA
ncbi:hypothetical protein Tco_1181191 [Tanacetum coccineum]